VDSSGMPRSPAADFLPSALIAAMDFSIATASCRVTRSSASIDSTHSPVASDRAKFFCGPKPCHACSVTCAFRFRDRDRIVIAAAIDRKTSPALMLLEVRILQCVAGRTHPLRRLSVHFVIKLEQQRCGLVPCQAPCNPRAPQTR
jgi:hypothetical protein